MEYAIRVFLDRYLKWVLKEGFDPQKGFDQAYGGLQLCIELFPLKENELTALWLEEYYPQFFEAVHKSSNS